MKATEFQKMEEAKAAFLTAHTRRQTRTAFLGMLTVFVILVVPQFVPPPLGQILMAVGGAALFSAYFCLFPDSLRNRSNSLTPALCLMGFLWLCAAITTFLSSIPAH